jgi:hypothetical protein
LALGRANVISKITREGRELSFAAIHLGDQTLHAGVKDFAGQEEYVSFSAEVLAEFNGGDFPEVLRLLDQYFGEMKYSLKSLFKDEQKRIIDLILTQTLSDAEANFHAVYKKHGPLLRFLKEMDQPVPEVLRMTAAFVLNSDLKRTFETEPVDLVRISMLLELVKREGVQIEEAGVGFAARKALTRIMLQLQQKPHELELLDRADLLTSILEMLPFKVSHWKAQNIYYSLLQRELPDLNTAQREWAERFLSLGEKLRVAVPALAQPRRELQMAS